MRLPHTFRTCYPSHLHQIFLGLNICPPPLRPPPPQIGPDDGTIEYLQFASLRILCWTAGSPPPGGQSPHRCQEER